jgi:hypothetical protein
MTADPHPEPSDVLSIQEAADELGIEIEQAEAMVVSDLLVPTHGTEGDPRFTRAAVEAVRLAGG